LERLEEWLASQPTPTHRYTPNRNEIKRNGMRLPNYLMATVDLRKLAGYALNLNHPEGRHKARVFLSALGLAPSDSKWLANKILVALADNEAHLVEESPWGTLYRVDLEIWNEKRCAIVRTGWLCTDHVTKLTTCFVVGECDETA